MKSCILSFPSATIAQDVFLTVSLSRLPESVLTSIVYSGGSTNIYFYVDSGSSVSFLLDILFTLDVVFCLTYAGHG